MSHNTRGAYLIPYYLWMVLFVALPVALVAYYSLFDIDGHFTFSNYVNFFTPVYLKMTLSSFWSALLITFFSLLVAYPAAYALVHAKHKQLWLLLLILPTWINLLLKAYAFIGIFGTSGPVNALFEVVGLGEHQILFTNFSFIFVAVYIYIPFMVMPIYNAMEEIHPSLIAASRDLGASNWVTLRRVIFPLTLPGVRSGCMAVFIPALSLFMLTRLIAGNKVITLGTAIEQHFLVTQDWGMGSTVAVFLILIMAVLVPILGGGKEVRK